VAATFPQATARIAVFVRGWSRASGPRSTTPDGVHPSVGHRLSGKSGLTPVHLRYNARLPLRETAEALAALIEQLHAARPVPVKRVTWQDS
jgi:hypothetical protein